MKRLLCILLIPLFVTVQSMAAVCSSKCAIDKVPSVNVEVPSEHQGCHQAQEESESPSSNKGDCDSKICQLDDIIKTELVELDLDFMGEVHVNPVNVVLFPKKQIALFSVIFPTGPPGYGTYFNIPLYIQKSAYLI